MISPNIPFHWRVYSS